MSTEKEKCTYALNLEDGRRVFYNDEVARQTAYAAIPDSIAKAIKEKRLDWRKVVEVIHKKRNAKDSGFSWSEFDKLRDQQNIRRTKFEPETLGENKVEEANLAADISMEDFTEEPSAQSAEQSAPKAGKDEGDNFIQMPATKGGKSK